MSQETQIDRIILTSMVKNEAKVIGRMIKSALPFVDAVFICDTGSTDGTPVVAVGASSGVHCEVAYEQWSDFATNRTRTIELAREMAHLLGWALERTWLLLLDGDQELRVISKSFSKKDLIGYDIIHLQQVDGFSDWLTPRVVRASTECRYVRRTHEYLEHKATSRLDASGVVLIEHGDGGSRADKYERDERLLRMDLEDNPNDERSMFYLARTLRDLKRPIEAISWYQRRVDVPFGGFEEERWMAQLQMARLQLRSNTVIGRASLWKAFSMRPWRSEPLLDLAVSHKDVEGRKENVTAYWIASLGKSIPYPERDILFVEGKCYLWEFTRVMSICAWDSVDLAKGLKHANELRVYPRCPYFNEAVEHLCMYAPKLATEWVRPAPMISGEDWHPCNPSIIKTETGYLMTVRHVNYKIDKNGGYYDFGSAVRTRTHLVSLTNDLDAVSSIELKSINMNESASIQGVEDVRLYRHVDGIAYGFGTRVDGRLNIPRQYNIVWDTKTGACLKQREMMVSESGCEKNWLPWDIGSDSLVSFIYSHAPFRVVTLFRDAVSRVLGSDASGFNFSGFSGSAAPVTWSDGWLYVVHECTRHRTNERRTYIHRFCWMNAQLELKSVSLPFYFEEKGVEFCSGMALHADGVVITYGINDAAARMVHVSAKTINTLLAD